MVELVKARRIKPNPRDEFIFSVCLFTIFCGCRLWGLKTPTIWFLFYRKKEEDDWRVELWLEYSNNARDLICFQHNVCFYILYSLSTILTKHAAWCGGWWSVWQPLGPGFDSQVHPIFVSIFSQHNHMQAFKQRLTIDSHIPGAMWPYAQI